jgi:hypothetical protein
MKLKKTCGMAAVALSLMTQSNAATVFLTDPALLGGGVPGTVISGPPGWISTNQIGGLNGVLSGAPGYGFLSSTNPLLAGLTFTFCLELNEAAVIGSPNPNYNIVNPSVGYSNWGANAAALSMQIDKLLALALPAINAAPSAASLYDGLGALQLSLWEMIYDYNAGYAYNLGLGVFQANSSAGVTAYVDAWLAGPALSAAVPTAHYYVAQGPSHQDLLAVPEPTTVSLVLAALAALALLGGAHQRRRCQA